MRVSPASRSVRLYAFLDLYATALEGVPPSPPHPWKRDGQRRISLAGGGAARPSARKHPARPLARSRTVDEVAAGFVIPFHVRRLSPRGEYSFLCYSESMPTSLSRGSFSTEKKISNRQTTLATTNVKQIWGWGVRWGRRRAMNIE